MKLNNGDMPASPLSGDAYIDFADAVNMNHSYNSECQGLTKREAFAMAAMQNILTFYKPYEQGDFDSSDYDLTAEHAFGLADAMLRRGEHNE